MGAKDPRAFLRLQMLEGFPRRMASVTALRFLVDHRPDLGRLRRVDDLSRLIEYADAVYALLFSDAADTFMDPVPIIPQHVVFGVRLDGLAELIRMPLHFREQALSFGLDIEVGEDADRQKDRQYHTEGQLKSYFPTEHISPATDSSASYPPVSRGPSRGNDLFSWQSLHDSAAAEKPKTFATVFINVNLSVFSPTAKDIGSDR